MGKGKKGRETDEFLVNPLISLYKDSTLSYGIKNDTARSLTKVNRKIDDQFQKTCKDF